MFLFFPPNVTFFLRPTTWKPSFTLQSDIWFLRSHSRPLSERSVWTASWLREPSNSRTRTPCKPKLPAHKLTLPRGLQIRTSGAVPCRRWTLRHREPALCTAVDSISITCTFLHLRLCIPVGIVTPLLQHATKDPVKCFTAFGTVFYPF